MPSQDRRSAGRRRAWGRGPIILKFDSLEQRALLSGAGASLPDLVGSSFTTTQNADWNDPITASGQITNQGPGTVTTPFNVGIYASPTSMIGHRAVLLGEVTIPAGLAPGQSAPFSTTVTLPSSPLPGMDANGVVHINLKVDPQRVVPESNEKNDTGVGLGHDVAAIQITPHQPARLNTTSIGIYPATPQWGGTLTVTAQISNTSYGDAPATRAQVILTPTGLTPGTGSDVTIGSIAVPAHRGLADGERRADHHACRSRLPSCSAVPASSRSASFPTPTSSPMAFTPIHVPACREPTGRR